jgi:uncharacterized membrane protein YphA (DoxX/SURF4 family)
MNMYRLTKAGRIFYAIAIAATGFQQLFYGQFSRMLFPTWTFHVPGIRWIADIGSLLLIYTGGLLMLNRKTMQVSFVLGGCLLVLFLFSYIPYDLFIFPLPKTFGIWTNALKELALSGGAFVIADSATKDRENNSSIIRLLSKLIPLGRIFFSVTMICFGIMHLLYTEMVSQLIPVWIPVHIFWTYLTGLSLIASGIAIIIKIGLKLAAALLGLMILIWLIFLHIPRAVSQPFADRGNEVISAFSALAFSGIAFVIAGTADKETK